MLKTLKEARRHKGLTQAQFGEIIGISQQEVAAYETGVRRPRHDVMRRIQVALDLSGEDMWRMFFDSEQDGGRQT